MWILLFLLSVRAIDAALTTCDFTWGSFFILNQATSLLPNDCSLYTNSQGLIGSVAIPTLLPASAMTAMQRMCLDNTAPMLVYLSERTSDGIIRCAGLFPDGTVTTDLDCSTFSESILCTWNAETIVYDVTATQIRQTDQLVTTFSRTTTTSDLIVISSSTISITLSTTITTIKRASTTTSVSTTVTSQSRITSLTTTTTTEQQTSTAVTVTVLPTTISQESLTTTTDSLTTTNTVSVTSTSVILTCPV